MIKLSKIFLSRGHMEMIAYMALITKCFLFIFILSCHNTTFYNDIKNNLKPYSLPQFFKPQNSFSAHAGMRQALQRPVVEGEQSYL